jgi:lambda repressor-like predicted transcriptional regulator
MIRPIVGRRSFLKGLGATGALLLPASALLINKANAADDDFGGKLSKGDAAILRFLAAAEIIESDLWEQYWELGGVSFGEGVETPRGETAPKFDKGNPLYTSALTILDGDMPQYITDNTDDEFSHQAFIRAYLASKGASTADIDLLSGQHFRTLEGSTATGSSKKDRLTNLLQLTVDTSFWSRYRDDAHNPDLDSNFTFKQAVTGLNVGQHRAIPKDDSDTMGSKISNPPNPAQDITPHLQVIAFTAGFHFAFIEQGGTSLYPSLAQRVSDPEVLRVVLSIGPTEAMHFQTWQDKAGNALPVSSDGVTFIDLHASTDELLTANLIMPEPCPFLSRGLPTCSIIRPSQTTGAAMGAVKAFSMDGLFIGQTKEFMDLLADLASDADAAQR